jgi:DNA-binding NarL/FixJ family response regulator
MPIRILIADDHPIVLKGLAELFDAEPDVSVVAKCVNGEEAAKALHQEMPDIAVLDLHMPGRNGLELLQEIRRTRVPTRSILPAASLEPQEVVQATCLGARGILLKESAPEDLLSCIHQVFAGERVIPAPWLNQALDEMLRREAAAQSLSDDLTPREVELVRIAAQGLTNREIGARLGISPGTVKIHLHNIYKKLGVKNRVELTLFAQSRELV